MTLPIAYSPSAIQAFLDCERKWGWQYLEDDVERPPSTPAQELGTDTHLQLEEYVGLGNSLDYTRPSGRIAETALEYIHQWIPFIPAPKPEFATEREFIIISPKHRYYGLIDLSSVAHGWVADYKTTSNLRYAKTSADLKENVQAIIYATNLLIDRPDLNTVQLRWLYLTTKGRHQQAVPIIVDMTRDEVGTMFAAVEGIADLMDSHQGKRALDLQPNPRMCEAFGGCPFRELCALSPIQKLRSIMSSDAKADGLLAQLTKKQNEVVATSGINPPEAASAPPVATPDNGAELAATLAQEPAVTGTADTTPTRKPRKAKDTTAQVTNCRPIGTLYVDCQPLMTGEKMQAFSDYVMSARGVIAATEFKGQKGTYKVPDYRMVEFGQGPAVLLAAIEQILTDVGRVENLFVQANSPEASICLGYLQSQADRVVLGTR